MYGPSDHRDQLLGLGARVYNEWLQLDTFSSDANRLGNSPEEKHVNILVCISNTDKENTKSDEVTSIGKNGSN